MKIPPAAGRGSDLVPGEQIASGVRRPAACCRDLSAEQFEDLRADIAEHGLQHPIIIDDAGLILDGRHR